MRSLDAARERLALWLDDWSQHGVGYWAAERREAPGVVVGVGGVGHKELEGQSVLNLSYRFAPSAWGSGTRRRCPASPWSWPGSTFRTSPSSPSSTN